MAPDLMMTVAAIVPYWFPAWFQGVATVSPISFGTAIEGFAALTAVGGLTVAVKVLRIVAAMKTAIYGDELSKEPSGLIHQATTNAAAIERLSTSTAENTKASIELRDAFGRRTIDEAKWQLDLSADVRLVQGVVDDMAPRLKAVERHVASELHNTVQRKPR